MKEGSHKKVQKIRMVQNGPPYLFIKKNSGGQQEEVHGVVHHLQQEHHQSYLIHYYIAVLKPFLGLDAIKPGLVLFLIPYNDFIIILLSVQVMVGTASSTMQPNLLIWKQFDIA